MKNIHILPTDKPSRLFTYKDESYLYYIKKDIDSKSKNENCKNQNIYITNDEEIKEGDWVYSEQYKNILQFKLPSNKYFYKKIILTTDQDLIKDGVQEIDDEFLEWFVKNPSCEEVEIEKGYAFGTFYKIIIPKEEPKQPFYCSDRLELDDNEKCTTQCDVCSGKLKQDALNHFLSTSSVIVKDPQISNFNKQETLEEVAERIGNNFEDSTFKAGVIYGVIEGAKWQMERSYSEEEVKNLTELFLPYYFKSDKGFDDAFNEWFEKLKNK